MHAEPQSIRPQPWDSTRPQGNSDQPDFGTDSLLVNLIRLPKSADSEGFLREVGRRITIRHASANVTIVVYGEMARAMFFVIRGKLKVTGEDGEVKYAELGQGSYFGEIGALFDVLRTASVVTITSCVLGVLKCSDLGELLVKYPSVKNLFIKEAIQRLDGIKVDINELISTSLSENVRKDLSASLPNAAVNEIVHDAENEFQNTYGNDTSFPNSNNHPNYTDNNKSTKNIRIPNNDNFSPTSIENFKQSFNSDNTNFNQELLDCSVSPCVITPGSEPSDHIDAFVPSSKIANRQSAGHSIEGVFELLQIDDDESPHTCDEYVIPPDNTNDIIQSSKIPNLGPQKQQTSDGPNPKNAAVSNVESGERRRVSLFIRPDQLPTYLSQRIESNNENLQTHDDKDSNNVPEAMDSKTHDTTPRRISYASSAEHKRKSICSIREILDFSFLRKTKFDDDLCYGNLGKKPMAIILSYLPSILAFKSRQISKSIYSLLLDKHNNVFSHVDLSYISKKASDKTLLSIISLSGDSVHTLKLSNCYLLTNNAIQIAGFTCRSLCSLDISNMWNTSDAAIISAVDYMSNLVELDLSNIRTISYTTILHIVQTLKNLKSLIISYCKNVTAPALSTIEWANLTKINFQRCTGISSSGFYSWFILATNLNVTPASVSNVLNDRTIIKTHWKLEDLCLSDCTFLEDLALMSIVSICDHLSSLSLSFCCALSEESVQYISKCCSNLNSLDLSFCGRAVTETSLEYLANMKSLQALLIRGCIQVNAAGIKKLLENSKSLNTIGFTSCMDPCSEAELADYIKVHAPHITLLSHGCPFQEFGL